MVICSACKAYTDKERDTCEHCGAPLQPDQMENIALLARHPIVAGLARDSERARLVASALVATNLGKFFYTDEEGRRAVLVDLFGSARDARATTAGVIFAAYAFLAQKGYCSLAWDAEEEHIRLEELRPWDGQEKCIERVLADQASRTLSTYEATDRLLRELMNFRPVTVAARAADGSRVRRMPELSAVAAISQTARLTALPERDNMEMCRETYRLLMDFVKADQERARQLALETLRILDWFETY